MDAAKRQDARVFDHHELRRLLRIAEHQVEAAAVSAPTASNSAAALRALESLEEGLVQHFRYEEQGGFFDAMLQEAPNLSERLLELQGQHAELIEQVRLIVDGANSVDASNPTWLPVFEALRAFVREIRRHENAEDALVADSLFTDEGGGG